MLSITRSMGLIPFMIEPVIVIREILDSFMIVLDEILAGRKR